jgi:hypothetical protein
MFDEVEDIIFSILDFSTDIDKVKFSRVNKNWEYLIYLHLKNNVKNIELKDLWKKAPVSKSKLYFRLNYKYIDQMYDIIKMVGPVSFEDEIEFLSHLFLVLKGILSTKETQDLGFFIMYQFLIKENIEYQLSYLKTVAHTRTIQIWELDTKKDKFQIFFDS